MLGKRGVAFLQPLYCSSHWKKDAGLLYRSEKIWLNTCNRQISAGSFLLSVHTLHRKRSAKCPFLFHGFPELPISAPRQRERERKTEAENLPTNAEKGKGTNEEAKTTSPIEFSSCSELARHLKVSAPSLFVLLFLGPCVFSLLPQGKASCVKVLDFL